MTEIDVSGCRFLDEYEHCGICKELCEGHCLILQDIECKTYEDCHYRQLKRLEQENQELGKIIDCKNGTIASLAKVRDELKEEHKKLKEKLEKIKEKINAHCAVCETMRRPKCDDCILSWLLEIIEGVKDV